MTSNLNLNEELAKIKPLDVHAMEEADALQKNFIKPLGSLGELENISIRIAGITGNAKNKINKKIICLFGSDHGIYDEGVSSAPQYYTGGMMKIYADKKNAGINILARQAGAELRLYDLGVRDLGCTENIITKKFLSQGSCNFLKERAMSYELAEKVIAYGISIVNDAKKEGVDLIGTGEVGMGNTTPAAACIMAALNINDSKLIGRGAGLSDMDFEKKKRVIIQALAMHKINLKDPLNIISCVGGLDIAAMTGVFIGCAIYRIPVVIDGVISIAAALLAYQLEPEIRNFMFASHESMEPAYKEAAKFIGIEAPLKLSMRLGEGTGCAIFMQIIDDAIAIINGMTTL